MSQFNKNNTSLTHELNDINIQFQDQSQHTEQRTNNYVNPVPEKTDQFYTIQKNGEDVVQSQRTASQVHATSFETEQKPSNFDYSIAGHPQLCLLTFFLKALDIFSYFFLDLILSQRHITTFVMIILFVSIDFWITKNITGRLLVGLRWQNQFIQKGDEVIEIWKFESVDPGRQMNSIDTSFFWTFQIIGSIFFLIYTIVNLFSLEFFWGTLCVFSFFMESVNLWGFYKCSDEHKQKVKQWTAQAGMRIAVNSF